VLVQTRRHSYLCHLLGIRNIVLAVNKMDLVGYDQGVFDAIVADYASFAQTIGITDFVAMPISGFCGNNITTGSDQTPWYTGPALIEHLETVEVDTAQGCGPPVPYAGAVGQSSQSRFPRLCGLIASGSIPSRRCRARSAVGQDQHGRADRDAGRRSRRSSRRAVDHADFRGRNRLFAR
jgi:bifunctional enzyme CysN/CysC